MLLIALFGCGEPAAPAELPFGMPLRRDGQLYAGIARVDVTPTIGETFTDLDDDYYFDGCTTDPSGSRSGCDEPFDDVDGDGRFEPVWMGGWGGGGRAARGVHDPLWATALVLALDEEYVAIVSVDAVGLLEYRTSRIRARLAEAGLDADRVIISANHIHQGPDTVGLWGDADRLISGFDPDYMLELEDAVHDAVATAAGGMLPVTPGVGAVHLADLDDAYNGAPFGGTNPSAGMLGLVHDNRDPIIVDDQVLTMTLDATDGRLVTLVSYSAHPEVVGYENDQIGADYVGYMRDYLEEHGGGTSMFLASAVGGMQTAWEGAVPAVDDAGDPVYADEGRVFLTGGGDAFARAEGVAVARASLETPMDTTPWASLRVRSAPALLPLTNLGFLVALRTDLLDQPWDSVVTDASCPGYGEDPAVIACVATGVWKIDLGPLSFGTIPGELVPELFSGVPDEAAMGTSARSGDARFPHHPAACDTADWGVCQVTETDGDCPCEDMHAVPYAVDAPLRDSLPGAYRAVIGLANGYVGYVLPEDDYSGIANALTGIEGNHAEEWYSAGERLAPNIAEAWATLER